MSADQILAIILSDRATEAIARRLGDWRGLNPDVLVLKGSPPWRTDETEPTWHAWRKEAKAVQETVAQLINGER